MAKPVKWRGVTRLELRAALRACRVPVVVLPPEPQEPRPGVGVASPYEDPFGRGWTEVLPHVQIARRSGTAKG